MTMDAVDLFAGPGGWSVACDELGIQELGIEWDKAACETRIAAGHETLQADVRTLDPLDKMFLTQGFIASPPCQTFSMAGNGAGRAALDTVLDGLKRMYAGQSLPEYEDDRTALVLEPMRWILARYWANKPYEWIALEQVPTVLPVWQAYADVLRQLGYFVDTGTLHAEQYGTIATCPLHETYPAETIAELSCFDLPRLATADPAGNPIAQLAENHAWIAEDREVYVRNSLSVKRVGTGADTTSISTEALSAAFDAALIARAVLDSASDATWKTHVNSLLVRALSETRILGGRAVKSWTSEDTFEFESTVLTEGNIESLPSRLWVALCFLAKSYTTSTEAQITTTPATSLSSSITDSIGPTTPTAAGRVLCGACDDTAVPQTRKRAILVARYGEPVSLPKPTHTKYRKGKPRQEGNLLPWVSMADALSVSDATLRSNYGTGGDPANRGERDVDEPAFAVTSKAGRNKWIPTAAVPGDTSWSEVRPSPTIVGSFAPDVVASPGWRKAGDGPRQKQPGSIRVTVEEAAILQSFPADYEWRGSKTKQFEQCGNAIPPKLAKAILSEVAGVSQIVPA